MFIDVRKGIKHNTAVNVSMFPKLRNKRNEPMDKIIPLANLKSNLVLKSQTQIKALQINTTNWA